jgi:cysteine-rich repeat protein
MATAAPSGSIDWCRAVSRTYLIAWAVGLAACVCITAPARAALVNFAAVIDGAQETPPNGSPAFATGTFVMDTGLDTLSVSVVILVPPPSGEIAAHIHGFVPPGVPAGVLFGLPPGSPKIAVWSFLPAQEADIIAGLAYVNIHSAAFPGGEIRGQILRVPSCGDSIVDGGEQCDDGNTDNDDCCDSTCQYEANGSPCEGTNLCTAGQCDGAGSCVGTIRTGCRSALKSSLTIKNPSGDKDKLIWKWLKGAATTLGEFGSPTTTTEYALCVYAGTSAVPIIEAEVAPSGTLWAPAGTTGLKYKDPAGTADGVTKVTLKEGVAGKAKALLKGKGADLPNPPAGPYTLPVTAQLVNSDNSVCFEGVYDLADIKKNEAEQFKAKTQ